MKQLVVLILAVTVITSTGCAYSQKRQIEDVRAGIYLAGKTESWAIRYVHGYPERTETGSQETVLGRDRALRRGRMPPIVTVETYYYRGGKLFCYTAPCPILLPDKWFTFERDRLIAWGEKPQRDGAT